MKSAIRKTAWPRPQCLLAALALPLLLAGCSALELEKGWRGATVVALGPAEKLAPTVDHDCAFNAAPDTPYLVVRYRDHGVQTWSLGTPQIPPGAGMAPGTFVHVNILDCSIRPAS